MLRGVAIGMLALSFGGFSRAFAEGDCAFLKDAPPQALLQYLQRDRDAVKPACVAEAMIRMSLALDQVGSASVAIKTLVRYLDYRLPDELRDQSLYAQCDYYPACEVLTWIGWVPVPFLIDTIGDGSTSEIARSNATFVMFTIYSRTRLAEAVRSLRRASEEPERFDGSGRLFDAAKWIATRCEAEAAYGCQVALYGTDPVKKHR